MKLTRNVTISVAARGRGAILSTRRPARSSSTIRSRRSRSNTAFAKIPEGEAVRHRLPLCRARSLRAVPRGRARPRSTMGHPRARPRGGRGRRLLDDLHDRHRQARRLRARRRQFFLDLDELTGANGQLDFADEHWFDGSRRVLDRLLGLRQRSREVVSDQPENVPAAARRVRCATSTGSWRRSWFGLLRASPELSRP